MIRHDAEHEARAAAAIRWRRLVNGEPPAAYVLDAWRERRRLARVARMTPEERRRYLGR